MPKKILKGEVVSTKMDKTIVVSVVQQSPHTKYKKLVVKTKKFKAHDEQEVCKEGDVVEIIENRPLSKTKRWVLKEVVNKVDGERK